MKEEAKDRAGELAIKDYDAETRRLAAVGNIDQTSLQIIVRQMVEQMLGTPLVPVLQGHAGIEQSLQPPPDQAQAQPAPMMQ
jgi:hypothetical protein